MTLDGDTLDRPATAEGGLPPRTPGVVIVFSATQPLLHPLPLEGGKRRIGRIDGPEGPLPDATLSRQHVEVRFDGATWTFTDLSSRNGTFVDGERRDQVRGSHLSCVRISNTLMLPLDDIRPFLGGAVRVEGGIVIGPRLAAVLARVRSAAAHDEALLIRGESGSGKELAAREYHAASARAAGEFIAVNCAAVPESLAERLFFGAKKGAYSGATADVAGYMQAANGGVLFLDEVGELDLSIQAKLLRVIEQREVLPLGAARAQPVDLRLCCATHRDLRQQVVDGKFRHDLLFRLAQASVEVPPLRERREEISWLVHAQLAALPNCPAADAKLIEQCVMRPWPGNIRELRGAVRAAAREVPLGAPLRLPPGVGEAFAAQTVPVKQELTRESIAEALSSHHGNVAAAARALGVQRTAFYRLMKKLNVRS